MNARELARLIEQINRVWVAIDRRPTTTAHLLMLDHAIKNAMKAIQ